MILSEITINFAKQTYMHHSWSIIFKVKYPITKALQADYRISSFWARPLFEKKYKNIFPLCPSQIKILKISGEKKEEFLHFSSQTRVGS